MTTEKNNNETKNQTSDQSTFAPLGKYAVIAILMVGVIVTTAIMLDKQLNKTETEIASIEDEISKMNETKEKSAKSVQSNEQTQVAQPTATVGTKTEAPIVASTSTKGNTTNTQQPNDVTFAASENATSHATAKTNADSLQARVDSQKTRMTEMFDRISKRESKQLEQFKKQQAEQVARLRKRVNVQQQQIDALIQRNENLFNLRSASVQRSQAQREQMLNRI